MGSAPVTAVQDGAWSAVCAEGDLKPGKPRIVELDRVRVAVFKVDGPQGGVFAIEDVCTHDDGPVAEGPVQGCVIECPRHGARFDLRTGAVLRMPAVTPIRTFKTRVRGGHVEVDLS